MIKRIIIKNLAACFALIGLTAFSSAPKPAYPKELSEKATGSKPTTPPEHYRSNWKKDPKVLRVGVIAFSPHGGHHTAAVAVKDALKSLGTKCDCKIVYIHTDKEVKYGECTWYDQILAGKDTMKKLISGQRGQIDMSNIAFTFREQFANTYDLYLNFAKNNSIPEGFLSGIGFNPENNKIYKHDWSQFDLIISVSSFIHNRMVYEFPEIKQNKIPVLSIPTDADDIAWGVYIDSPNIAYLLCSNASMKRAKKMEVKEFKRISGLPLRAEFKNIRNTSKEDMKQKLGFDKNKPLLLVDFGAAGQEQATQILNTLSAFKNISVAFICGRSQKLKAELETKISQFWPEGRAHRGMSGEQFEKPDFRVLGLIGPAEKAQYMRAADLIAGKTGGLTSFEALQCETPIVVLLKNIIPNEKPNAEVLLDYNCCKLINCWSELPYTIEEIVSEKKYREGPSKFVYSADEEISNFVEDIADNYEEWQKRLWENKEPISAESSLAEESISPAQ